MYYELIRVRSLFDNLYQLGEGGEREKEGEGGRREGGEREREGGEKLRKEKTRIQKLFFI